ncbi:pyridoxal phosphate-dependent transferase [Aspergillus navahoensis]
MPVHHAFPVGNDDMEHSIHFELTGEATSTLNLSPYNYLSFALSEGLCADTAEETVYCNGISMAVAYPGTTKLLVEVEDQIARLVGKDPAIVFSTGIATNTTIFPALVKREFLILAAMEVFAHNNMASLEEKLKQAIPKAQPRTPIFNIPRILELKQKYKFYFFIEEAHSIGAIGNRERGVCVFFKVDPADVDILMGTFTESFGANCGYVPANQAVIDKLRCISVPNPRADFFFTSIHRKGPSLSGQSLERMQRLTFNSRYPRLGFASLDFIIYGHDMPAFSRMLRRKIYVIATYPATPFAHTKDDLDSILEACDEVGEVLHLKVSSGIAGGLKEPRSGGATPPGKITERPSIEMSLFWSYGAIGSV